MSRRKRCLASGGSGFAFLLRLIVGVVGGASRRHLGFIGGAGPSLFSFLPGPGVSDPSFPLGEGRSLPVTSGVYLRYGLPSLRITHPTKQGTQACRPSDGLAVHEHQPACCAAQRSTLLSGSALRIAPGGLAARVGDSKGRPLNTDRARSVVPEGGDGVVEGTCAY
jgi:hypothetical protein